MMFSNSIEPSEVFEGHWLHSLYTGYHPVFGVPLRGGLMSLTHLTPTQLVAFPIVKFRLDIEQAHVLMREQDSRNMHYF